MVPENACNDFLTMMKIDFEDTRTAFSIKSDRDLRRAYALFKLISYPILVKIGNPVIQVLLCPEDSHRMDCKTHSF